MFSKIEKIVLDEIRLISEAPPAEFSHPSSKTLEDMNSFYHSKRQLALIEKQISMQSACVSPKASDKQTIDESTIELLKQKFSEGSRNEEQ